MEALATAIVEELHPDDLNDHSKQLRKELKVPQTEPYTVAQGKGNNKTVCGLCGRQFETKGGVFTPREHTSKTAFAPFVAITSCCHLNLRPLENGSNGASCPRLVFEGMCGRNQRTTGEAPKT
ncbi:unnamed protein product [Brugia pahangi]|uniref:Nanos-type domain-containing protein n=1 Tax=Brugia pahangi TaxID=6280 RepID=A0A0N4TEU9_BRUPA|nr:unnamed protein product [Brugia pahangi]